MSAGARRSLALERRAVAVVFFVTGATFGSWAARIPAVQERVDLDAGELGVAFTGLMVGAFAGLPLAGALVGRLGSRPLLLGSLVAFVPALALIPLVPNLSVLTALLTLFGAANSGVDVAMNVQGAHVERRYGRPILSSFHALFSGGALAAAGAGAALAGTGVSVVAHFLVVALVLASLGVAAVAWMTAEPRDAERTPRLALPTRALAVPGLIAFSMVFAEDVANTWSAVYLRTVADTGPGLAAGGFAVYSAGMLAGRAGADRFVAARGARFTLVAGGVVAAAGTALAIALPEPTVVVFGLLLLGLGLSPVFPVLFGVVAHRDPASAGTAIAAVTTVGYLGSVAGPPSVGAFAEPLGLRAAFVLVPLFALVMAVFAGRLRDDPYGGLRS